MTTTLADWAERVRPDVPKCPVPLVQRAILDAAREFCEGSRIWYEQLSAIKVLVGVRDYQLTSANGRIIGVKSAKIDDKGADIEVDLDNDRKLWLPYTPDEDSDLYLSLSDLTYAAVGTITSAATDFEDEGVEAGDEICVTGSTSNNRRFNVDSVSTTEITVDTDTETVTAEGTADASGVITIDGLVVWVFLQPEKTATSLPDILWNDWETEISDGARWRLMRVPKREWTSMELAAYYRGQFENAIASALGVTHRKGFGNRQMRIRNPNFVV